MTSTLPSRWQEILRREAAANVGTVLAQAREQPDPRRVPRGTVPSLAAGPASPHEKPFPLVINIGTRSEAVLSNPVITGAALAPATARLANDVYVGDRLAMPAGTVLVGEGFATQQDDRAQVVFTAMVKDGKTIQLEGWALQEGETGIHAKLVRKGSKAKKGAGTVLGAAASALSFGLGGAMSGPEGGCR